MVSLPRVDLAKTPSVVLASDDDFGLTDGLKALKARGILASTAPFHQAITEQPNVIAYCPKQRLNTALAARLIDLCQQAAHSGCPVVIFHQPPSTIHSIPPDQVASKEEAMVAAAHLQFHGAIVTSCPTLG